MLRPFRCSLLKSAKAIAIIALLGLCNPQRANAADIYALEDDGTALIYILGKIVLGDDEKFRSLIIELIGKNSIPTNVSIFSNGGAARPAMEIGRQIKLLMLPVSGPIRALNTPNEQTCIFLHPDRSPGLWKYYHRTETGDTRCRCDSACFLIWAGGGKRTGEGIYIHRPYFNPQEYGGHTFEQARAIYQRMQAEVTAYLREVEVPDSIIARMFSVDSTNVSNLTPAELQQLRRRPYVDELLIARCGPEERMSKEAVVWAWQNEKSNRRAAEMMSRIRTRNGCEDRFWAGIAAEQKDLFLQTYRR